VRAGGDLCLVCHREDYILQAYEALTEATGRDAKFARRATESVRRVAAFKKQSTEAGRSARSTRAPSNTMVDKLTRQLWEFGEQVRLEPFSRRADKRRSRS